MRFKLALAVVCAVAFVLPASGHHSHGNYSDEFTDIEGKVTELHLLVPHSWLYIEVEGPDGEPQIWALEASDRNHLAESGITRGYLQPGDAVKARCHPVRDGSPGCLLGFLKHPDGTVKDWDGNNAPAPEDF